MRLVGNGGRTLQSGEGRRPSGAARYEAERLVALARDMLDERDQIARDHLGLALSAFSNARRLTESLMPARCTSLSVQNGPIRSLN